MIVIGIPLAGVAGFLYRKHIAEQKIGGAEQEARRIVEEATKAADAKKRELLLEAKEEAHRLRLEFDKEVRERRSELQRLERRVMQRDETLER